MAAMFFAASPLLALDPEQALTQYGLRLFTTEDGLPLNAVTAVTGTRDGYLWVGTQDGLARFDGVGFTVFDRANTPQMTDSFVSAMLQDRRGVLWIGTRKELLRYEAGRFERLSTADGLPHEYVRTLALDHAGRLLVGTYGGGLARLGPGKVLRVYGLEQGLTEGVIRVLHQDHERILWVGTSGGLFRFQDEVFKAAGEELNLPGESIRAISEDFDNVLWLATDSGRLIEVREGRFRELALPAGAAADPPSVLYRDRQDALWLGTQGAGIMRSYRGQISRLTTEDGLAHDVVWSFYEDQEGSLWVGTRGGLNQLLSARISSFGSREGLSGDSARALVEAADGTVWVGTDDGGLSTYQQGRWQRSPWTDALPVPQVRSLLEDAAGTLWVGTRGGLVRFGSAGPRLFEVKEGLPSDTVNALAEGGAGQIWVGTSGGLAKIDGDRVETVDLRESPEGDLVRCLLAGEEALWVGTEQGLVRWTPGGQERLTEADGLPNNFVYSLYRDREGILWVGTGGGLARQVGDGFVSFKSAHGLYSDLIFSISEDETGHLWFSSNRGIFRVDRRQLPATGPDPAQPIHYVWFDNSDGMRSSECNGGTQPAVLKAKDGRFWYPTVAGVAILDPHRLKAPAPQSPLLIEGVLADGLWLGAAEPVKIPAGTETVEVRYSSPTFLSPRKISFRYRLAGFDRKWNQAGFRRQAIFTRLPRGRYRFVVSAANEDKVWGLRNAELQIEVLPFFYQLWWFLGLLAVALLAVLVAFYRWWLRRHRLNESRLLEQVRERTQELQEANRKLERMASVDALTGIANQRRFRKALDQEWRRAVRQGTPLALMLVDVDFFKAYNDTYGHLQGDRCLVQVATALAETLNRGGDLVARYGGEEFAAILSGTDAEGARLSGERVRQAVEALAVEHRRSAVSPWVTVSVGVAATEPTADAPFDAADRLLGEADVALYASKRSGRNRVI